MQLIFTAFTPFNFAVLFGSRNKGHANIKGFTVLPKKYGDTTVQKSSLGEMSPCPPTDLRPWFGGGVGRYGET